MKSYVVFSALIAIAAVGSSVEANLIVNGDFETGSAGAGWTQTNLDATNSGVKTGTVAGLPPHGGTQWASLSNFPNPIPNIDPIFGLAEFSQTVSTNPGQTYDLSFSVYVQGSIGQIEFKVMWDNTTLLDIVNPAVANDQWVNYDYVVSGTGNDTAAFFGLNDAFFNGLDDVSLNSTSAVPEPSSLVIAMTFFGSLGFVWSHKRLTRITAA